MIISMIIQFVAAPVVGLFTADAAVVVLGTQYIRGYIWDCIFAGIHFSFSGYFCAIGRSELSFIHNITAIVLVRVPGVYLTSKLFPDTLFPMGLATVAGSLTSVVICLIAFHILKRQKKLHKNEEKKRLRKGKIFRGLFFCVSIYADLQEKSTFVQVVQDRFSGKKKC